MVVLSGNDESRLESTTTKVVSQRRQQCRWRENSPYDASENATRTDETNAAVDKIEMRRVQKILSSVVMKELLRKGERCELERGEFDGKCTVERVLRAFYTPRVGAHLSVTVGEH